jgi:hypothetical protein
VEPHKFDLENSYAPARQRVYLLDANGIRIIKPWKKGRWKFHFALLMPQGEEARDLELVLSTFYYNPIIHGWPN